MTNKFITVMEAIGRDALKVITEIEKYLPKAQELADMIFPAESAAIDSVVNSTDLILKGIVICEQKMAAANLQTGTGAQKSADLLSIAEPAVTQLLTEAGIKVDTAYIQKITDAIVADLNVRVATIPGSVPSPAV